MSQPLICIRGLKKSFGKLDVLKDICLDVNRGQVVALIGPSGSGKSTLLRCINLLTVPDGGEIRVDAQSLTFSGSATRCWPASARAPAWCSSTSICSRT